ncbi:MAG: rod shape-determining protein MreC [Aquabacterium sp.]|jgi:rod shape-determining protein MreC|uniref:rod shape-determining protein MreC n=1 Tax=Aquabacterium sp. TaxID=1872578 RepID=UPI002A35B867|nr:rod shape-determining protein MreC [Aquabacterium sp.]MDX9844455.1 rod shape-determining protein MreC [Aquabacterium sp.]
MPLATLDRTPPAFFKQGPSAFTRLLFFSALAILLMVADARWKMTQPLRAAAATLLQPVQSVLLAPVRAWEMAGHYVAGVEEARALQARAQQQLATQAERVTRMVQLERENSRLRELLALRPRIEVGTLAAEVLYDAPDPYTRKVVIDQGSRHGVSLGAPVIDERGVVGQVTRVYPVTAEVTLVTDKDAAVPVVNVRTQHRGVAYGLPQTAGMELRFMAGNADVQAGDELQTSGLDGIYPAGVPVAKVVSVDRRADSAFARIVLSPLAQPDSSRHVLLLQPTSASLPPRPEAQAADAAAEAVSVSRSQP